MIVNLNESAHVLMCAQHIEPWEAYMTMSTSRGDGGSGC